MLARSRGRSDLGRGRELRNLDRMAPHRGGAIHRRADRRRGGRDAHRIEKGWAHQAGAGKIAEALFEELALETVDLGDQIAVDLLFPDGLLFQSILLVNLRLGPGEQRFDHALGVHPGRHA